MDKEKDILKRCKKENPFKVPDGYFDTLTSRIMSNIPTEETKVISIKTARRKNGWIKWSGLVAACFVGALICINAFNKTEQKEDDQFTSQTVEKNQSTFSNEYQDVNAEDLLDYAMVDYTDVYCYLSGGNF